MALYNSATTLKIKYFPFGGRGTALRLAAYLGKFCFEDEFVSFDEFKEIRPNREIKWCTLPQIVFTNCHGKRAVVGQSNTCLRFIGSLCNMYPANTFLAAFCDEVMDCVEDIMLLLAPSEFCGDEDKKKALRKELCLTELPTWLQKLEWRLEDNRKRGCRNGFIVGDQLTVADCKLWCFIRHFGRNKWREGYYKHIDHDILDRFPALQRYKQRIGQIEGVKEFDILWRRRHKGFKQEKSEFPKCYTWQRREDIAPIPDCSALAADVRSYDCSKQYQTVMQYIVFGLSLLLWLLFGGDALTDSQSVVTVIGLFYFLWSDALFQRTKLKVTGT